MKRGLRTRQKSCDKLRELLDTANERSRDHCNAFFERHSLLNGAALASSLTLLGYLFTHIQTKIVYRAELESAWWVLLRAMPAGLGAFTSTSGTRTSAHTLTRRRVIKACLGAGSFHLLLFSAVTGTSRFHSRASPYPLNPSAFCDLSGSRPENHRRFFGFGAVERPAVYLEKNHHRRQRAALVPIDERMIPH